MGTRALSRVTDEYGRSILVMYSQYDGYPKSLGAELHKKLGHLALVNGFGTDLNVANGMGCFAAQLVASVKDGVGGFYIQASSDDTSGIEFLYDFRPDKLGYVNDRRIMLKVTACWYNNLVVYEGPFADFDPDAAQKRLNESDEVAEYAAKY